MDKIYLVLNNENVDEPFVINICSTEEKANALSEQYRKNFIKTCLLTEEDAYSRITIKCVELTDAPVLWDCYGDY